MHQHPPQPRIVLLEHLGHGLHGHLGAEHHHEGFHHQGKTAAFPRPGHRDLMDPVLATPEARHLGHQFATVLEKVQVPPAPFDRVVYPAPRSTLGTLEMLPPHVLQSQFQALGFSFKAAFGHPPLRPQSQGRRKECFRCHGG
jgi:hypothetical protein